MGEDMTTESEMETEIERLVGAMTLDEKASLTAGANLWYLPPVERLGIPALKVSDGPSGVRGDSLIGRRSLSLPCGMAIGSTWNPDLVRASVRCWPPRPAPRTCTCCSGRRCASCARRSPDGPSSPSPRTPC